MFSDDEKLLHEIIRRLIDIENAMINNNYRKAHYLLTAIKHIDLNETMLKLRTRSMNMDLASKGGSPCE